MKKIKVIIINNYKNIGDIGNIILVKSGYAKNYLIPNNIVILLNKYNLIFYKNKYEQIKKIEELKKIKNKLLIDKINKLKNIYIYVNNVNKNNKIFGSINKKNISNEINSRLNINEINENQIIISSNINSIKFLGKYSIKIKISNFNKVNLELYIKNKN